MGFTNGDLAVVDGYYSAYDGGGGTYNYESASMVDPNDGSVVALDDDYTPGTGYDNLVAFSSCTTV